MLEQCTSTFVYGDAEYLRLAFEAFGVQGVTVEAAENGALVTPTWSDEEGIRSMAFGLLHAFVGNAELRAAFL